MDSNRAEALRLRRDVNVSEIHWSAVSEILSLHFRLPAEEISRAISQFKTRMNQQFGLVWFINDKLSHGDNAVSAAICESLGADSVTLRSSRAVRVMGLSINYENIVNFSPNFRPESKTTELGSCKPIVNLSLSKFKLEIATTQRVLLAGLILSLMGALMYAVAAGALLYGLSVFLIFIVEPAEMTKIATLRWQIGLALLCTLIGIAGIGGKAIRNLGQSLRKLRGERLGSGVVESAD